MATLQNIRNRGVLIAIVVGIAMFAFIIGDFLNSGSTLVQESKQTIAEIAGEKIRYQEFQASVDQLTDVYKIELGRTNFTEEEMAQIRAQVWETMVNEKLIELEAKKIGLTVSKEELKEHLIGDNIHPLIQQRGAFVNPQTGQFDKDALLQFYSTVFDKNLSGMEAEQVREAKSYWLYWENTVKNALLQDKYFGLIGAAVGANKLEAQYNFDARKSSSDVEYVYQAYSLVDDAEINISDAEIKSYYDKNKALYKQDPNRTLKYVSFEVRPLEEDYQEAEEWIAKISEEFTSTDDIAGLVNAESDVPYTDLALTRQNIPAKLRDFAFSSSKGAVFGPVFENDTYTMAKVMETGIMESDSVKLRLILLPADDKTVVDSVLNAVKGGADFINLLSKYSDPSMLANGGEVGWITRTMVGKEISDPAFATTVNGAFKVEAGEMAQIFQVMEKTPARSKVKLAILEREITPSNQSYSHFYNEAKQFAASVGNDIKKFEDLAEEKGYILRSAENISKNSESIHMIPQSRQIVRWAYENKKGAISDVFDCDRNTYVVAALAAINEKEFVDLDVVSDQIKAQLTIDKKAEVLMAQLKDKLKDKLNDNTNLETLAEQLGTEVAIAPSINFASFQFGDQGNEPYIIGKASVMEANKVSELLKGRTGVYVIKPLEKSEDTTEFIEAIELGQLNNRISQSLPYTIMQKLKDKYSIVDNRSNFY